MTADKTVYIPEKRLLRKGLQEKCDIGLLCGFVTIYLRPNIPTETDETVRLTDGIRVGLNCRFHPSVHKLLPSS